MSAAVAKPSKPVGVAQLSVTTVTDGKALPTDDWLSEEVPVEIRFNGEPFAVMMATPNDWVDFAYGFARSEAGVSDLSVIEQVEVSERLEGVQLDITTAAGQASQHEPRLMPGRSGCGLCGARVLEDVVRVPDPVRAEPRIGRQQLERALASLGQAQPISRLTGSLHAAAWISLAGEVLLVREDVGRHNALDKLLGALWRASMPVEQGFLLVTSRASYEMVTKAATAGIAVMAAISAPTALAVRLAESCQLTLLGFARAHRYVVYSHPRRLTDFA